jgi:hypothetical protein
MRSAGAWFFHSQPHHQIDRAKGRGVGACVVGGWVSVLSLRPTTNNKKTQVRRVCSHFEVMQKRCPTKRGGQGLPQCDCASVIHRGKLHSGVCVCVRVCKTSRQGLCCVPLVPCLSAPSRSHGPLFVRAPREHCTIRARNILLAESAAWGQVARWKRWKVCKRQGSRVACDIFPTIIITTRCSAVAVASARVSSGECMVGRARDKSHKIEVEMHDVILPVEVLCCTACVVGTRFSHPPIRVPFHATRHST